jgi:N-acetylglucosamine kinase-like BadF-type ATPase
VSAYLGVDGGGSKTAFLLIDENGSVLASHTEGPAYYLEIGWEAMRDMLARGILATFERASCSAQDVDFCFLGLPAYGEDSRLLAQLDASPSPTLAADRYRCGNDAASGWAGAFACADGINLVAGTGSIGYGEFQGRSARAGGWGELFSDEGSAHWIAREALTLFSRMSDGRAQRGPWYDLLRTHFGLQSDLDLCAAIYGDGTSGRSQIATLAPLAAKAASAGDAQCVELFERAAQELAQVVDAVRDALGIPAQESVDVSYSGGVFKERELVLQPFTRRLTENSRRYRVSAPRLPPVAGAALYAAKLSGTPLGAQAVAKLEDCIRASSS